MADIDPFEAAMAGMESPGDDKKDDGPVDPFEAALAGIVTDDDDDVPAAAPAAAASDDPFAAAMASMGDGAAAPADDPFENALTTAKAENAVMDTKPAGAGKTVDIDFLMDIKLNVSFEVGRAKMYISDLLSLGQGSVIELHRLVGEELELFVNGHLMATGEVVVINEKFGARISEILNPEDRIKRLGPFQAN